MARQSRLLALPPLLLALLLLVIGPSPTQAVKRGDFKTCNQSGFCKRNRALADRATEHKFGSPYTLQQPQFRQNTFHAAISNALFPSISFSLEVRFQKDGVARILMDEVDGLRQRYNEAGMWTVQKEPQLAEEGDFQVDITEQRTSIKYAQGRHELQVQHQPLLLTFLRDGQPHIIINERSLLNLEHFRVKAIGGEPEEVVVQDAEHPEQQTVIVKEEAFPGFLPKDEDGMWEETFGGKTDSKPKGELLACSEMIQTDFPSLQDLNRSVSTSPSLATSTSMESLSMLLRSLSSRLGE